MRKIFTLFTLAFAIGLSSCKYDDTDLWNAVNDQEERIAARVAADDEQQPDGAPNVD